MKNILILADGSIAKNFIDWVCKKRVAENKYYIISYNKDSLPEKIAAHITHYEIDPTSFLKIKNILNDTKYSNVFISMQNKEEAYCALHNIRLVDKTLRIVLVNQWEDNEIEKDMENITVLDCDDIIASHLYDYLPNVPVIAQNVGLGKGDIMEVHVPFGSTYAFRHVGSILQRKWRIAAIYRDKKQIIPTNATMIRPNDTLLIIGKPIVLDGIYKTINKRVGLFPEPFGKDLYLILDFRYDRKDIITYLKESLYLVDKLEDKNLVIRVIHPNNFALIDEVKSYESSNVTVIICYDNDNVNTLVEFDIQEHDIGLVLSSIPSFESENLKLTLFDLKKVVYLFGDEPLYNIKKCIILMGEDEKMESISSTAFDISESLSLSMTLADFNPEGDFESNKIIVEHYETLSHIFNMEVNIEQKIVNPIREILVMEEILQIAPFEKILNSDHIFNFISTKVQNFLLTTKKHPKLLVPFDQ